MSRAAAALSRRRPGSVGLMVVILMVPIAMFYATAMNNGQAVSDRQRSQDAADSVAQLHATWSARSLNLIAMNNVEAAQLMTVAIGSEALDGALWELKWRARGAKLFITVHSIACLGYLPRWPITLWCLGYHDYKKWNARRALSYVARTYRSFDPEHGIRTAHRGLRVIDALNREIAARFSAAMGDMMEDYRRSGVAETIHVADPCQAAGPDLGRGCRQTASADGMALPLEPGGAGALAELCAGMTLGTLGARTTFSQKGFPLGRGPVRAGGSAANPHVKDHINEITGIGRALQDFYDFHRKLELPKPRRWTKFPQILNLLPPQRADGPNAFTLRFDGKLGAICGGGLVGGWLAGLALQAPIPEMWRPIGTRPVLPGPRRPEDMDPAFHILAYAHKAPNPRTGTARLRASGDRPQFAYGQAGLYTLDGANLFSQNWRGDLMPASRIDSAAQAAAKLTRQAPAAFAPLARILQRISGAAGQERLNVH